MSSSGEFCCKEIKCHIDSGETPIRYIPKFREFGLSILDGGTAYQLIHYCPWCGSSLPASLRDEWFDIVYDELELEDVDDPNIPKEMLTDQWWRDRNIS